VTKNRRISKKSLIAAAIAVAVAVLGAVSLGPANADTARGMTVTGTGATKTDAWTAAKAQCEQHGYNSGDIIGTVVNPDTTVTMTMSCVNYNPAPSPTA
jgi:hypothetical protein